MPYKPFFSIITPVWNTKNWMLEKCIDSVLDQSFQDFELILSDDASSKTETLAVLKKYLNNPRVKIVTRTEQGGIVAASNDAIDLATGEFVCFLDHDDELVPHALERVKREIDSYPNVDYIFSDEDHIDEAGNLTSPFYKPGWSKERIRCQNYCCHLSTYRRSLLLEVGKLREGFDGSQDYDLVLRFTENTKEIRHIAEILYHWRIHSESVTSGTDVKPYAYVAAKKALEEHSGRLGWDAVVEQICDEGVYEIRRAATTEPLISIIIPTAFQRKFIFGQTQLLVENTIKKIHEESSYQNIEFVVVTNVESSQKDRDAVTNASPGRVKLVDRIMPFNFSAQVNYATTFAKGELFLMLNDDTEIIDPDSIGNMAGFFNETDVGIVGSLLIGEENLIQNAGTVLSDGKPGHYLAGFPPDDKNFWASIYCSRDISAVTFAVAMTSRKAWFDVGGLWESLPNCYNDVDFCAKLWAEGYRVVWTPQSRFYHFESATRFPVVQKWETELLNKRWKIFLESDPFTSSNMRLVHGSLRYK